MNKPISAVELQAFAKSAHRHPLWSQLVADPNVLAVASFCLVGILLTLNFMLRFADMGAVITQYNQF
jgi:hypothetical protein